VSAVVDYSPGPNKGMPARTPVWSGAFAASWRISSGEVDNSSAVAPSGGKLDGATKYASADKVLDIAHPSFKIPIYISNSVKNDKGEHYAGKVENFGTPFHAQPWKIAYNATQVIKLLRNMPT
jgi:hypothetical protein